MINQQTVMKGGVEKCRERVCVPAFVRVCVFELLKSNSYFKLHGNESNLPCQDGLSHFRYYEPYSHGGNFPLSPLRVGSWNAGIM